MIETIIFVLCRLAGLNLTFPARTPKPPEPVTIETSVEAPVTVSMEEIQEP